MTKGFLTIAAVLALVLLFAAAAVPETEQIIAPEPTVSAQIPTARYQLTADERELICEVVMAESGTEPFDGKMAVSQCILNACEKTGKRPAEIVEEYGYTDLIVLIVSLSLNALINLILAIYSLITDDSDGSWYAPNFLASVALIIVLTQQL